MQASNYCFRAETDTTFGGCPNGGRGASLHDTPVGGVSQLAATRFERVNNSDSGLPIARRVSKITFALLPLPSPTPGQFSYTQPILFPLYFSSITDQLKTIFYYMISCLYHIIVSMADAPLADATFYLFFSFGSGYLLMWFLLFKTNDHLFLYVKRLIV